MYSGNGLWYGVVWTLVRRDLGPPSELGVFCSFNSRDFLFAGREETGVLSSAFSGLSGFDVCVFGDFCAGVSTLDEASSVFGVVGGCDTFCGEVALGAVDVTATTGGAVLEAGVTVAAVVFSSFGPLVTGVFFSSTLIGVVDAGKNKFIHH